MKRQRGLGVAIFLIVLVLGALAGLVGSLSAASQRVEREAVTERALAQAKAALIGRAARDENRPGSLPCPDTDGDGSADGSNCSAYVGYLPWRTLGLTDLRDGSGARLWYALSPSFRDENSAEPINNNKRGDIELQSPLGTTIARDLVAMVIAPERPVALSSGPQMRPSTDPAQYLEFQGFSPSPPTYAYRKLAESNDAITPISHGDLFTVVDHAVFERIDKSFVPKMRALASQWGRYPFAATFNPANVGLVSGQTGVYEGSPPFASPAVSTAFWQSPTITKVGGTGTMSGPSCQVGPAPGLSDNTWMKCDVTYGGGSLDFRIDVVARRAGRSFHDVTWDVTPNSPAAVSGTSWYGYQWGNPSASSSSVRFSGSTTGTSGTFTIYLRLKLANWADPDGTPEDTDWILRNDWHRQLYYALAPAYAFDGAGWCGTCVSVNGANLLTNRRAVLVLAGRQLNGTTRTSALSDYLENENGDTSDGHVFRSSPQMPQLSATSVTRSGTTVTVSAVRHGLSTGSRVRVVGADASAYNGDWTVASVIDANTFTYALPTGSSPASPATGEVMLRSLTQEVLVPVSVTRSGTTVTLTFPFDPGLTPGSRVRVQGATSGAYNGDWVIATAAGSSLTYQLPAGAAPASPATGRIVARTLSNDRVAVLAP